MRGPLDGGGHNTNISSGYKYDNLAAIINTNIIIHYLLLTLAALSNKQYYMRYNITKYRTAAIFGIAVFSKNKIPRN